MISNLPKIPDDEYLSLSKEGLEYILNHFDPQVPDRNFLWTTDYRVELPVRVKKSGPGSEKPYTLVEMWKESLAKFANLGAVTYEIAPNQWKTITYKQYYEMSVSFAKSLIALGIPEYTAVNIIGFNSIEWAVAFYGSIFGHYLPIGLYTSNGPDACAYIANHSQAQIVFLEDASHLKKYIKVADQVKGVRYYVVWKGAVPTDLDASFKGRVFSWKEFMAFGEKSYKPAKKEDTVEWRMDSQKAGSCATFIYTSGTTGPPKAVMISHDSYTWVTDAISSNLKINAPEKVGKGRIISLLPLSHVAAQLLDLVVSVRLGGNVFFTDPSALQGNLVKFLVACKPTMFLGVPRVWEKIQEGIIAAGSQVTGLKKKIADWAKSIGAQGTYAQVNGGPLPSGWSIAKKLVFDKVKANLGLDQCETFIFAAAPLKESTRLFFLNLNIYLMNIYGMSELSGPETVSNPKLFKDFRSIEALKEAGQAFPGLELRIANPDAEGNGQICLRGRNTFMGYYKNEKETRETIDNKGFVHSGDVGVVGANKCLTITGRIKELLITAGGQNVAPVLIENEIHTAAPIYSQIVAIGDKKKYLSCLLVLKTKSPGVLADEVVNFVKPYGSNATTVKDAIKCPNFRKAIQTSIDQANTKAISNAQKIQRFVVLDTEFSVDGGELTPTLKLKRKIINQKYEAAIESMYENPKL